MVGKKHAIWFFMFKIIMLIIIRFRGNWFELIYNVSLFVSNLGMIPDHNLNSDLVLIQFPKHYIYIFLIHIKINISLLIFSQTLPLTIFFIKTTFLREIVCNLFFHAISRNTKRYRNRFNKIFLARDRFHFHIVHNLKTKKLPFAFFVRLLAGLTIKETTNLALYNISLSIIFWGGNDIKREYKTWLTRKNISNYFY